MAASSSDEESREKDLEVDGPITSTSPDGEGSPRTETVDDEDNPDVRPRSKESPEILKSDGVECSCQSNDEPNAIDGDKGTKRVVPSLVRSSSSPALHRQSNGRRSERKSNDVEEIGLSDVTQVLFSTKNLPAPPTKEQKQAAEKCTPASRPKGGQSDALETNDKTMRGDTGDYLSSSPPVDTKEEVVKHRDAEQKELQVKVLETKPEKRDKTQSGPHRAKQNQNKEKKSSNTEDICVERKVSPSKALKSAKRDKTQSNSKPAKRAKQAEMNSIAGDLTPVPVASTISNSNSRQRKDSQEMARRATMPEQRELEAIERIDKYQRENPTPIRYTFSGGPLPPSPAKSKATERKDLLSRFITYNDQLTPTPAKSERRYTPLPQHSPKAKADRRSSRKRGPGEASKKGAPASSDDDGVRTCVIPSGLRSPRQGARTPEAQRPSGLSEGPKSGGGDPPSSATAGKRGRRPRSVAPLVLDVLRIVVIMFATASIAARCFITFGGNMRRLWHHISNSPILWTVRWHIAVFHFALIIVELNLGVPVFLPKGTLDNFFQKGFVVSFIGLLDLCMNSNKSLVDVVDEMQSDGGGLSERGTGMTTAFAVVGISSRGLAACGVAYILLGVLGYDGELRRRLSNGDAGLAETRIASV